VLVNVLVMHKLMHAVYAVVLAYQLVTVTVLEMLKTVRANAVAVLNLMNAASVKAMAHRVLMIVQIPHVSGHSSETKMPANSVSQLTKNVLMTPSQPPKLAHAPVTLSAQSSTHDEPSPSQMPHSSNSALPPHSPVQSSTFPAQSQSPAGMPEPPHTPHASTCASPKHSPAQSISVSGT
jgi:hypothetical protein